MRLLKKSVQICLNAAGTNFFWTQSHAIGAHSSSRSHTPNPIRPAAHGNGADDDDRIGTPLKQNTLAPSAAHRPSLPAPTQPAGQQKQIANSIKPVPPSAAPITTATAAATAESHQKSPPCNECGASIV